MQLGAAATRAEDAAGLVPPELLDVGIVEETLQRAVAGDEVVDLARPRLDLGDLPLGLGGGHLVEDVQDGRAHRARVGERVGAALADERAHTVQDVGRRCRLLVHGITEKDREASLPR